MPQTKKPSDTQIRGEDFFAWKLKVDTKLKLEWKINLGEAGLSDNQIINYWEHGMSPANFVEWYAAKYNLHDFNSY